VNNDPINWVDPWGLARVSAPTEEGAAAYAMLAAKYSPAATGKADSAAAGAGRALEPDTVITADRALGQLEFEGRYGFGDGVTPASACQAVSMVNAYAFDTPGGVSVEDLDRAVAQWKKAGAIDVGGDNPGEVESWASMSQTLARQLERDTYLEFVYPLPEQNMEVFKTEAAFRSSGATMGIALLANRVTGGPHWVFMTPTRTIDSMAPNAVAAGYDSGKYRLQRIQTLQRLALGK
jgi:hypothetical protein